MRREPPGLRRAVELAALEVIARMKVDAARAAAARRDRAERHRAEGLRSTADVIEEGNRIMAGLPVEDRRVVWERRRLLLAATGPAREKVPA